MATKKGTQQKSVEDILQPKEKSKKDAKPKILVKEGELTKKDVVNFLSAIIPDETHNINMSEHETFDKLNMLCNKYNIKDRAYAGCGVTYLSNLIRKIAGEHNG